MKRIGVIVDLETTGLSSELNEIIEIGLIEFSFDDNLLSTPQVLRSYGSLAAASVPVPEEITKLTGITDDSLVGQAIDWSFVMKMFSGASIIIAHNIDFDRAFLLKRPELTGIEKFKWGCSFRHIDWRAKGFKTRALNYLAADHGFINPFPHRAIFDCATTLRVISTHLVELWERSGEKEYLLRANKAPYEAKEVLRLKGYSWSNDERIWSVVISESRLEEERLFLKEKVYGKAPDMHEERLLSTP